MRTFILSMTAVVLGLTATQTSEAADVKVRVRVDLGGSAGHVRPHPVPAVPAHLLPRHGMVVGGYSGYPGYVGYPGYAGYSLPPHGGYVTPGYTFPGFASPVYGVSLYRAPAAVYVGPRYYIPDYALVFGF